MSARIYVPIDSGALSLGAEQVARAIRREAEARGIAVDIVRNGSRGLFWLEPLVEVVTPQGRVAYGPVQPEDVPGLFDAGVHHGAAHPLCHGRTEQIPFLARQERLTFARVGLTDPLSLEDYLAHGGFDGLKRAIAAARPSRPASSGRRCSTPRRRRSTSSATPTRATPAPSPTAC